MKNTSPLQFTEHHRFYVFRDFSLSPIGQRTMWELYQPMVGHGAVAFYQTLYRQIEEERLGYSAPEQQRSLFYAMGLELGENGRRTLIGYTSQLEAVGLLRTTRCNVPKQDERIYVYYIEQPLHPRQFFEHMQLPLLLKDCLGKHAFDHLLSKWTTETPSELLDEDLNFQDLSVDFASRFKLSMTDSSGGAAMRPIVPMGQPVGKSSTDQTITQAFSYDDLVARMPKRSTRRKFIVKLKEQPQVLSEINYIAVKHAIPLTSMCRMLDDIDGVFDEQGRFYAHVLDQAAKEEHQHQVRRNKKLTVESGKAQTAQAPSGDLNHNQLSEQQLAWLERLPVPAMLTGKLTSAEYLVRILQLPHTQFIQLFLGHQPVHERTTAKLDQANYYSGCSDPALNVLIHFMYSNGLSWNETYVDKVINEWTMSRMISFEDAVMYFEKKTKLLADQPKKDTNGNRKGLKSGEGNYQSSKKTNPPSQTSHPNWQHRPTRPNVEIMQVSEVDQGNEIAPEKLAEIRRKAREYEENVAKKGRVTDGFDS